MTSLTILSPLGGTTVDMAGVDDPVFSAGLVGPGIAIQPDPVTGREVLAPIAGTIVKLHPHAFVVRAEDGRAVLVHLGINTVQLEGKGFTLHVEQGATVERGALLITWDPAEVEAGGRSAVCPVVALEAAPGTISHVSDTGIGVVAGTELLRWAPAS